MRTKAFPHQLKLRVAAFLAGVVAMGAVLFLLWLYWPPYHNFWVSLMTSR